ncbi:site-specific integrase [Clostridium sp. JN-9]|uniref:site-specific integrase n=1 Tax=Clostridium sp. JN-9 TaxID=2507159 RepID=UPI0013E8BAAF|nr:site-specific integrase [Clostridium sp. JN-9]
MNEITIQELINCAIQQLHGFYLCGSTIDSYQNRAFKPISDFYQRKGEHYYRSNLTEELKKLYQEQYTSGDISRKTLNWCMRGIEILQEIHRCGYFEWKVFTKKKENLLSSYYDCILSDFIASIGDVKRINIYRSISQRYFLYLFTHGHDKFINVSCMDIKNFMVEISESRPKSMDDVVVVLKRLHYYLRNKGYTCIHFETVLFAPRVRDKKIFPCIAVGEIQHIAEQVNQETPSGKRDSAILQLGIHTGLRAGDIANLRLNDIDWKNSEIRIIQGKTQEQLTIPLDERACAALIEYILNGRPKSNSPYLFLRSIAPYNKFKDGVSIACVFRKYLKKAGLPHFKGDGRTFHGIRRTLGTEMVLQGVPLTTVSQVLGHRTSNAARQYISLNMDSLRQCALGFDSIGGGVR